MKKIITLITMFVLSVGFLMAQGVFTYQGVVVDKAGNLVANTPVTAVVTITDEAGNSYVQEFDTPFTTSLNGLAVLSIGDNSTEFNSIDWSTASIKVVYTPATGVEMPAATAEQIPAVPYALQSNAELTTDMIVDYISNAKMDDVMAILKATEENGDPSLHNAVLAAIIDSLLKENYYVMAKDVILSYIEQADTNDADQLFAALTGNEPVMNAIAVIVADSLKTPRGKAMIYDVLQSYAKDLNDDDVTRILAAVTPDARDEFVSKAIQFYLSLNLDYTDADIHAAMEELTKYYIENIDTNQLKQLIASVESNSAAMAKLLPKFNEWIDVYVDSLTKTYIKERYAYCDDGGFDLCAVKDALNPPCFKWDQAHSELNFDDGTLTYVATFKYVGTATILLEYVGTPHVTVKDGGMTYTYDLTPKADFVDLTTTANTITVKFKSDDLDPELHDTNPGAITTVEIDLSIPDCTDEETLRVSRTY